MDDDLVQALRLRGVDVQTALESGLVGRPDEEHLAKDKLSMAASDTA